MRVSDVMTRSVRLANPEQTIREAARTMAEVDAGVLPVADEDRIVGMLTDRDIVIRGVAEGKGPDTPVREVMTPEVKYCFEDEDAEDVARKMGDSQVRRLPVLSRDKRLVGILSLGDLSMMEGAAPVGETLSEVSKPGGERSQKLGDSA